MARTRLAVLLLALPLVAAMEHARAEKLHQQELAGEIAQRVLGLSAAEEIQTVAADWNGRRTIFADFMNGEDRRLVALLPEDGAGYRTIEVTRGEPAGGNAEIAAIGFANADRDIDRELIVILTWHVSHYDVSGTLYEVRVFDAAQPDQTALDSMPSVNRLFETNNCHCEWRDGRRARFQFRTIDAVKSELRRAGF